MGDKQKPDQAMARMLKRKSAWPSAAAGEACPEAGILAAYFERSLSRSEMSACETHFAICDRCQQQLAALVRSEPASSAQAATEKKSAFSWVWDWRFVAPVGAAAVVLAFVISFNTQYAPLQSPAGTEMMAKREAASPTQATSAPQKSPESPAAKSETAAAAVPERKAFSSSEKKRNEFAADELKLKKDMATGTAGRAAQGLNDKNAFAVGRGSGAITAQAIAKAPEQRKNFPALENRVVVAQAEGEKPQSRSAEADRARAAQLAAPPAPAAPKQVVVEAEAKEQAAAAPAQLQAYNSAVARKRATDKQQSALDSMQVAGADQKSRSSLRAAPGELVVATPKSGVMWRFKDSGRIERTQNGGKSWEQQKSPTPLSILDASAPSEDVCWAGGTNGILLRTTDRGENWVQMPSPTKNAIVSLKATDQLVVTVVSADGRTYETRDAGEHWRVL